MQARRCMFKREHHDYEARSRDGIEAYVFRDDDDDDEDDKDDEGNDDDDDDKGKRRRRRKVA